MTDALRTYSLARQTRGTTPLEDALAADLRYTLQLLHATTTPTTPTPVACGHTLAGGALVCTRTTPHTAPKGCTYQSTSGTPGAPKEEM